MRLAACALSAVLLSGCSWLGMGGGYDDVYGYNNYGYGNQGQGAYGADNMQYGGGCAPVQVMQAPAVVAAPGCAPGQGYAVSAQGQNGQYGAVGGQYASAGGQYAAAGEYYGAAGSQYGAAGAQYGAGGMYGASSQGATTLSSQAPYGVAAGGQYGGGAVQTIQGAPIYMSGPAGTYGGANMGLRGAYGAGCCGGGGAMPFGLELAVGTEFGIKGDISPDVASKPFLGGPGSVSALPAVSYNDAFKQGHNYNLAATYDLNRNTTLIGQLGYSNAKGQRVLLGTVDDGGGTTEDLYGEFSELERYRIEGGIRHYVGGGYNYSNLRPYIGATAGASHTNGVTLTQSSATLVDPALFTQQYLQSGWSPTASGIVGAEWAVGNRTAVGIESGIRWADGEKTNLASTDQWSIPLKLRGRVSF